jgi:hypothetical protein
MPQGDFRRYLPLVALSNLFKPASAGWAFVAPTTNSRTFPFATAPTPFARPVERQTKAFVMLLFPI